MSDLTTTDAEITQTSTLSSAENDGAETPADTAGAEAASEAEAPETPTETAAEASEGSTPAPADAAEPRVAEDGATDGNAASSEEAASNGAAAAMEGASEEPAQVEGSEEPAQVEGSEEPVQVEGAEEPAQVEGAGQPAQVEGSEEPAQVEGSEEPAQVEGAGQQAEQSTAADESLEEARVDAPTTVSTQPAAAEIEEKAAPTEVASKEAADDASGEATGDPLEAAASGTVLTIDQDTQPGETMTLLEKALADKMAVQGQIIGWNKGGYHVAIGKIAAFCPVSQIEAGNPRSPKRYLDKTFPFQVIEIQDGGRRVVVSRAAALEAAREARAALVREHLKPGSTVSGKVSSLTDFGAFVDLGGGIEGLVHVSELSRRRIDHPKEILRKGQDVEVSVLKIEKSGERISLSMKRLEADPWAGVAKRFPAGSEFTGKILRKADFGLFIEVEPGLEGLVHTSRLPLGRDLSDDSLEVGTEVSGWIHDVEARRRRLSLSLRELAKENPWRDAAKRYPVGEVVKGRVERLASFGVFIELEPGLTGLLPFSVLSARAGNPRRMFHPGKEVSVRVLSIDRDKRRISLGTETSHAEGSPQDFKEYMKSQKKSTRSPKAGLGSLAAAFAKARGDQQQV